jgi:hypothetical protein
MKKFILIIAIILCGCSSMGGNGPANFDNNEYALINKIYTLSEAYKIGCGDREINNKNFSNLSELSLELVNYSTDIPNNVDTINLVMPLNKMISDANIIFKTENHNILYCKLKLDNIETAAGIVKSAVAKRRRK